MTWQVLETGDPELAAFGRARFTAGPAYLATIRADGGPRLHPVTPIIGQGRLFLFMEPTSPKGEDIRRNGWYVLHASVQDNDGGGGEFWVRGRARPVDDDPETRALARAAAPYQPAERYVLFELDVEAAASTTYADDGGTLRRKWPASAAGGGGKADRS